jgi:UDP-glucose 4-epimerase
MFDKIFEFERALANRAQGDPPMLTASAANFGMIAGTWMHHELDDMIRHAWAWYQKK